MHKFISCSSASSTQTKFEFNSNFSNWSSLLRKKTNLTSLLLGTEKIFDSIQFEISNNSPIDSIQFKILKTLFAQHYYYYYHRNHLCTEVLGELLQSGFVFTNERESFEESLDRRDISGANGRVKSVVDDVLEFWLSFMQQLEWHVQRTTCIQHSITLIVSTLADNDELIEM